MDDIEMLTAQNKNLDRENRKLRSSLRDEFAKAALNGMVASRGDIGEVAAFSQSIADDAYRIADAMLEARKS